VSSSTIREAVPLDSIDKPENGFNIIYADPPWRFNNKRTGGSMVSGAENHYPTMSIDELKALPVEDISAHNSILIMWYVGSQAQEAIDLVNAWGFTLKNMNGFVWEKLTSRSNPFFGMGNYTRAGSESAIIATRGTFKRASASVRAVRRAPVSRHSKKPDEFRNDIISLCGDVPRLELFARQKVVGWDVWGNEV
jgi:N6-adenosine-specific RNA methylase IME4